MQCFNFVKTCVEIWINYRAITFAREQELLEDGDSEASHFFAAAVANSYSPI